MSAPTATRGATAALAIVLAGCGSNGAGPRDESALRLLRPVTPIRPALPAKVPGRGSLTAYVPRATVVRASPDGRLLKVLPRKTQFGSARVLAVVKRRGDWLGVLAPELPNGTVGWLRAPGISLFRIDWTLQASLSKRVLVVRRHGRVFARVPIAVGRPGYPTPRGLFAVTDKLLVEDPASPYGCCVLALSGHQPNVPQGWGGGDRLAIHATPNIASIGRAASLGCLRVAGPAMRRLVYAVPDGARLRITD